MSVSPDARKTVVVFDGGTVTAPLGTIKRLFPGARPRWTRAEGTTRTGRRRGYRNRQRSNAAAGEAISIREIDGDVFTVRVTGSQNNFIDNVIRGENEDRIIQIWSERGTLYGAEWVLDGDNSNNN